MLSVLKIMNFELCNYDHHAVLEYFLHPRKKSGTHVQSLPILTFSPRQPLIFLSL